MKDGETKEEQSSDGTPSTIEDDWNYDFDLYPERRKGKREKTWLKRLTRAEEFEVRQKLKCEVNVHKCFNDSSLVKLMLGALKSSGCEIDIRRHISCEVCDKAVTGGYDTKTQQIIICQNHARSKGMVQGVLVHEMIHMFDYCRNKVDLRNLDHLACTEIRAANLTQCSFLGAMFSGQASPFNVKRAHQVCVKDKAVQSIMAVRRISKEVAEQAIERVFDKCYNDLEPIGRRIRRNSLDMDKAYEEGYLYGYHL